MDIREGWPRRSGKRGELMGLFSTCAILVGLVTANLSALELRAMEKQLGLPAGRMTDWDAIGTYTLKGERASATVKLF